MGSPAGAVRAGGACRSLLLAACLAVLTACGINPPMDLSGLAPAPATPVILDVPLYTQTENHCGPAALAMLLTATGIETRPEDLAPGVFVPALEGSLQVELISATRRAGGIPYVLDPTKESLVSEIYSGRPVLLLQNLRTQGLPAWHYSVLAGLDPGRNLVRLHSGAAEPTEMDAPRFLRTWNWGARWAMVALRPGELPANPDPARYLEAVADFESVAGSEAAETAWRAAERQWPDNPGPALALGNAAYRRGDAAEAARQYADGLALRPGDPVLANNLASVLGELGCPRAGEAILAPVADALDGISAWAAHLAGTLEELAARPGDDPPYCTSFPRLAPPF